jgi:LCP family protein required for cell wall assembly
VPDDERLGGTRDPHEYGRRHRREDQPEEKRPGRRRRSVDSGGVSVADLVQRHTGSRPDLTPVDPEQLRQNSMMTGRRARQDDAGPPQNRQNAEARHPSISSALEGDGFPPAEPARRPAPEGNGFPRDEAGHRPGGTSSYYTIPSEAIRDSVAQGEPSGHHAVPAEAPDAAHRSRQVGETSAYYNFPEGDPATDLPNFPPPPETPRRNGNRRPGRTPAHGDALPPDGFSSEAGAPRRRADGPRNDFLPEADPRHAGFPPEGNGPRPRPRRRAGETSAHYGVPGGTDFPPELDNPRRPGEASTRLPYPEGDGPRRPGAPSPFPPEADGPRNGTRRPGEASAHQPFPGDADNPRSGSRRVGDASAHLPFPPDPDGPRNGTRRAGEASAHLPFPSEVDNPRNGTHRTGEASAHLPFPPNADGPRNGARRAGEPSPFPPDADGPRNGTHRAGEASAHLPFPPNADDSRNGTHRTGEASAHLPFPPNADGPRNGARRAGEPSPFPPDADNPRNGTHRAGEASAHLPFPPDVDGPRNRRAGEASAQVPFPDGGFRPEGDVPRNGSHRAGEASAQQPFPAEGGFPPDPDRRRKRPRRTVEPTPFPPDGQGFPPDAEAPRNRHGADGGFPAEGGGPHPGGPRRAGEAPHGNDFPPDPGNGNRRGGQGFPPDVEAPHHGGRRVGEASTHLPMPGDGGFAPEVGPNRPEGVARRRAARAGAPRPEPRPGRFPADPPPQPGQASGLFPVDEPRRPGIGEPVAELPDGPPRRPTGVPPVPLPPPRRGEDDDPISMTTEMEAIGDEVQKRRSIDHTLARFSAVHDEIKAEEREKKAKRRKLMPWQNADEEMDHLDELEAQQSMAMAIPKLEPRDDEEDEDPKKAKKKRLWRKGKSAGKAFTIVIAALVFLSTAVLWGFKSYIENSSQSVDALDPDSDAIQDASAQLGDENFLLVGSDTRAGATAEDGVGDENAVQGARSDTVMIAHIPKNRERVVVVSFPRDLEVTRPACEGWDSKTGNYTGEQHEPAEQVKLNTAYQVGGPKCMTKLIQELSGLAINHFVGIDFHGFKDMVEAVEGVEVCVERPLDDEELGMVVPEAGKNVLLTGDQALNFVRARKVKGDITADYGRIIRQQRFLSSLLRKSMSGEVLLDPGKLTNFVKAFSKSTFGDNIGVDQLFTLGQSMQGVAAGRVTFITVPTTGYMNDRNNEDLRVEDNNLLFEAIRQDTPLPGETGPTPDSGNEQAQAQGKQQSPLMQNQPAAPVDPKTIKIQVMNGGNDTANIAGNTADDLAELGFQVLQVTSAPPTDKTVIRYSKAREAQAQTLKAAVPGATLVEDPSMSGAIMLVIGPDFDGEVQSPTEGAAVPELPDNLSTVNAGDVSCA